LRRGYVAAIEYYLPRKIVTTQNLADEFPDWSVEKIDSKTGIRERHIAGDDECASDLAVEAARKLFDSGACQPSEIDFILYCTQSPDYFLPTTACIIQDRLGVPTASGAYDFNLGCSGYVFGLGQAEGLIATDQASNVLLLTAETYSKFIHPRDRAVRTIFGDAAAATLISSREAGDAPADPTDLPSLGPFVYGTDGSGAKNLMVPAGGFRQPRTLETAVANQDSQGNVRSADNLVMEGGEIFDFTIISVPASVALLLRKTRLSLDDIDLFIFHQANRFMLDHLRKKMKIPSEKFVMAMSHCGNTVSSSIPIALKVAMDAGRVPSGSLVMLVGFGVGYSWGAMLLRAR
jgi:3-oxoacyl-[acyl-carrier-protein] synthase III